jgi:UDP-N-acetylglucosamine acyltransferase
MATIHPTSHISKETELGPEVEIGPLCVITGRVSLARGVRLIAGVHINGPVTIGEGTILYPGACIGFPAQDYKVKPGDPTAGVVIGAGCLIREHATVHAATKQDQPTRLGDKVFMMVNAHVGHDGRVGNNVVMVNNSGIGGHAQLHDNVTLGGAALVHQFDRVGRMAFVSGSSAISTDIPPFCMAWKRNRLAGLNLVGMRRGGIPRDQITTVREAYRLAFRSGVTKPEMLAILRDLGRGCPPVAEMAEFVATATRPIAKASAGVDAEEQVH